MTCMHSRAAYTPGCRKFLRMHACSTRRCAYTWKLRKKFYVHACRWPEYTPDCAKFHACMQAFFKHVYIWKSRKVACIPFVSGSSINFSKQSIKFVPLKGSPPIPTHVDWPSPTCVVWFTASYVNVPLRLTMPDKIKIHACRKECCCSCCSCC